VTIEMWLTLAKLGLVLIPFALVPVMILLERRGAAFIQDRPGPSRAAIPLPGGLRIRGFGMVHNFTDGVKLFFKESLVPSFAYKPFYILAPAIPVVTAVLTPALIPWFGPITLDGGVRVVGQFLDANSGILALFALSSLSVYGVVLGSWASNSKYSLLGGMRASAMMISYEVSMGLGALGLFLLVGSFSLTAVVEWQAAHAWGILVQPVGFFLFVTSMFAECNRSPFDVAEGESELVAGFHTEYSAIKFALYFMGEYCHIVIASALIATLYLGGYSPFPFDLHAFSIHTETGSYFDWLPKAPYDAAFIARNLGTWIGIFAAGTAILLLGAAAIVGAHKKRYASFKASDQKARAKEYGFFIAVFAIIGLLAIVGAVGAFTQIDPASEATRVDGVVRYPLWVQLATAAIQVGIVLAKTLFFCWVFVWVRWTVPRMRYDQIMALGWKVLLNVALVNLLVTAIVAKLVGVGK